MKKFLRALLFFFVVACVLSGCQSNSVGDKNVQKANSIPEMVLNEPLKVETEYGDYTVTISGATDVSSDPIFGEDGKKAVRLAYSYTNESFEGENSDLLIDMSAFQVVDDTGTIVNKASTFSNDGQPIATPIGATCNAAVFYYLENNSDNITVTFYRGNNEKLGRVIVPIK